MRVFKRPPRRALILLGEFVSLTSGCSILTDSQLDAVSRQAKVLGIISDVPSGVMTSFIEVRSGWHITQAQMIASSANSIEENLRAAINARAEVQQLGQRVDIALGGIRAFGEQIEALSSKDFSQENIDAAKNLGTQVDGAAKALGYQDAGLNLGATSLSAGTIVATVTRFIGNTYIRNKQSDYLREAVARGQPVVSKMLDEVIGFMDYISPASVEKQENCEELLKEAEDPSKVDAVEKNMAYSQFGTVKSTSKLRT